MEAGTLFQILAFGGTAYLLLNIYAHFVADRLLFAPRSPSYCHLPNEVKIMSGGGERINAVFLEHPHPKCTLLFSHGNAEDLGNVVPFMEQFRERGYSVLMYDYRGYGSSEGRASTVHAKQDVEAAYHWLVEEKKIAPDTIVSQGRSLGGGVAVWLAARHKVGGVITEISFASAFRVKTRWKLTPLDRFDSLKSIRRVGCPVLVVHGTDDPVIPFWHGKKVFDAALEPKRHFWIKDGRHNDYVYIEEQAYFDTVDRFVDELVNCS